MIVHDAFLKAHSSPKYRVGVRESPYVRHPVCQMVCSVAQAIVWYANFGPVGCTLNVDGWPLPLFYAPLFPSDQLTCDVFDLLSPTSQPLPHLRSFETSATHKQTTKERESVEVGKRKMDRKEEGRQRDRIYISSITRKWQPGEMRYRWGFIWKAPQSAVSCQ